MQQTVRLIGDKIRLSFRYDPEMVDRCKSIGMRWSPAKRDWYIDQNKMNERLFDEKVNTGEPMFNHMPITRSLSYDYPEYLMNHQWESVEMVENGVRRWLFAHDTGVGKTLLGIELIRMLDAKTLVVCPLSIIQTAWFEDLKKFEYPGIALNLWRLWKNKEKIYIKDYIKSAQLSIVNFETFKILYRKEILTPQTFDMVIVDESSKIKNQKSQITKDLIKFCDDVDYAFLFSGTPAPNSRREYFSQARIVDPTIFGKSYYKFRNHYYYSCGYGGYTWAPHFDKENKLMEKIAQFSSVVRKEDVLDLPERTSNIREVHLNKMEKAAFVEMCEGIYTGFEEGWVTASNAGAKAMKLRELSSGFLYDDYGIAKEVGRSKLNELVELLDEIGKHQVIIWTQFIYEAEQIIEMLTKSNRSHGIVNGSIAQGLRETYIEMFKKGELQYMVAHPKSLGHGQTLTNCTYAVYYSISFSHEEHYQSRDRIYRMGQKNACTYYYLLSAGTNDRKIYRALENKEKVSEVVFNYIKNKEWTNGS